jgi:hypothetical protein
MECGWDDDDYNAAAMEQRHPCEEKGGGPAPTNAPLAVGLVTAGLMATESQKVLAGDRERSLAGRQVMLDLRHHTHYVTTFQRRHCRFDHEIWLVEPIAMLPSELTLSEVVQRALNGRNHSTGCALRIEGQHFTAMQCCPACGYHEATWLHLASRIPSAQRRCKVCSQLMTVRGFDLREWVDCQALRESDLARPLSFYGVEPCDVLSVRNEDRQQHFVLGASTLSRTTRRRGAGRRPLTKNIAAEVSHE